MREPIVGEDLSDGASVSAIVPIYNEMELCEPSLRKIHAFLGEAVPRFEIIVVESGSTDGTGEICDRLAGELENLRVIHEGSRRGMGSALRLGYRGARMNFVWLVTVDLPFELETLSRALPHMDAVDCALSYRVNDDRGGIRKAQSWVYATLVRVSLALPMRSVNSAFKLLRRDFVQSLPLVSNGWFLDAEILYWIARRRLRYVELPVAMLERAAGRSSVTAWDWIKVIREFIAFRASVRRSFRQFEES